MNASSAASIKRFQRSAKTMRPLKRGVINTCVGCYFTGKLAGSKSCYIQTFSAKIWADLEFLELGMID